eukprot:Opistho-2@96502
MPLTNTELLATFVQFTSQTAGRDKIYRTLQYVSKILGAHYAGQKDMKLTIEKLSKLEGALGQSRKLFRLFKSLDFVQVIVKNHNHPDTFLRVAINARAASLAVWLIFDHIVWAAKVGLISADTARWTRVSSRFWLFALAVAIAKDIYVINAAKEKERKAKGGSPQPLYPTNAEQKTLYLDLIRDSFDIFLPASTLGYVQLSTRSVGIVGLVSSLIGGYQQWPKLKTA